MSSIKPFLNIVLAASFILWQGPASSEDISVRASKEYRKIGVRVTARVKLPRWYHEGLFWDGEDVWVANGEKGRTWVVDTKSGKIKREISSIAGFTEGIAKFGDIGYLVTDWDEKKIYLAAIKDGWFVAQREVSLAPAFPAGVVWTGEKIYVIGWTRGAGTRFDIIELSPELDVIARIPIKRIQEPAHIAWDGKYLWITSWYSKMVYKVDPQTWLALGWFMSPVSMTTGIAWDGGGFWITGTYGDLYRVEVIC